MRQEVEAPCPWRGTSRDQSTKDEEVDCTASRLRGIKLKLIRPLFLTGWRHQLLFPVLLQLQALELKEVWSSQSRSMPQVEEFLLRSHVEPLPEWRKLLSGDMA